MLGTREKSLNCIYNCNNTINNKEKAMTEAKPVLLYVEDEQLLQELIDGIVGDRFDVVSVGNLAGAREFLGDEAGKADFILLDLVLPDGSGLDLVSEIRERGDVVPIVIFSAHEVTNAILGVDGVLLKGSDPEQILEVIDSKLAG